MGTYLCQLNQHFEAHKVENDDQKCAYFLSWVGTETFELLQKLSGNKGVSKESYQDLIKVGSYASARDQGLMRLEGKDYIMQEGDIVNFRFNV